MFCEKHLNSQENEYNEFAHNVCKHIITQKSRNLDRKGMLCGDFTFDSIHHSFCKNHIKRHPEVNYVQKNKDICQRSSKVRFFPSTNLKQKIISANGGARFTYNLCILDKPEGSFEEIREKYVTKICDKYPFLKQTPKEIRAFAVKEYLTNLKNSNDQYESKLKKNEYCKQTYLNYKSKKK